MTFDQMYDEMLGLEFSDRGKHAKAEEVQPAAAVATAVATGEIASHARHAKVESVEADAAAPSEHERATGFARYRNAALVGAGGLACATVGALLGGLGGYFTVSPAAAHAVGSTTADGQSTPAVHRSAHSSDSTANAPLPATAFSPASGGLTQAGSGVGSITASPSPNSPVPGVPVPGGTIAGGSGSGAGSGGSGGTGGGGSTGGTNPTTQPPQPASPAPCQSVCVSVPSLPVPLPVPVPTVPALPLPTPLPVTVQTSPTSSGGTSTSVTATAPAPLPTTPPPVTVGPVSVGTTSGTSSTTGGLTLNLG
jgi:hypothetical protein